MYHLLCTGNDKDIQVYSITRRFLITVKQTERHLRALDSESRTSKLTVSVHFHWYIKNDTEYGAASVIRTRDLTLPRVRSTAGAMAARARGLHHWIELCKDDWRLLYSVLRV